LLLEIQEPSDTTYRLFDYNRPGLDGAPRPLHIAEAVQVSQLFPEDPTEVRCGVSESLSDASATTLVDSLRYRIEKHHNDGTRKMHFKDVQPHVVIVLDGYLKVDDVELAPHDVAVIPACWDKVDLMGDATFVLCAARA
jgi:mannose-6-phosphate isomerase